MAITLVDYEFVENAATFIESGFRQNCRALLVASPANAAAVHGRLSGWLKSQPDRLVIIDAVDVVNRLTADGFPDELDFYATFDHIIGRLPNDGGGKVHVVSEIPALAGRLCSPAVSAVVDGLWQGLHRRHGHCEFMVDFAQTLKLRPEDLEALRAN